MPKPEQQWQELSDHDRSSADADQTGADLDQTLADSDQAASDRDQLAADRDQRLADRDQELSDGSSTHPTDRVGADRAQRGRSQSAADRARSTSARLEATEIRLANATRRDRAAADRDAAAAARDRLAASIDAEFAMLEAQQASDDAAGEGPTRELVSRMAAQLKRAAHARNCAAAHRDAAALDREEAARDRDQSAHDREQAARELERESVDHLTGALGRRAGLIAIQRELDRTARSGEPIVVAFVDVDDLKAINDTQGHPAGDKALRGVARCIKGNLRSYDVVMRFGGDEFVCSLAGQDLEAIRARFERIAAELTDAPGSHRISVGLTQRQAHETLDELIARADEALLATRRLRREPGRTEERSD